MRDISASHIARDQHRLRVMRADSGMEHGAPAAGSDNLEISGSGSVGRCGQRRIHEQANQRGAHALFLARGSAPVFSAGILIESAGGSDENIWVFFVLRVSTGSNSPGILQTKRA